MSIGFSLTNNDNNTSTRHFQSITSTSITRMYSVVLLTTLAAFAALATAQLDFPSCATACMNQAIGNTTCGLSDYYCQCTTGQSKIQDLAIPCLCTSDCTSTDLLVVLQDTNKACESALSASSQTFTPASVNLGACATIGAAVKSGSTRVSATTTGTSTTAAATGSSGSATATAAQQTGTSGASAKMIYGEAAWGVAGLVAFAL